MTTGQELELETQAASHLTRVLRLQTGAELVLFNGDGCEYPAHIVRIQRQRVWVLIDHAMTVDNESPLEIHLCQGISKGERMDYTIQKAVELGVTQITPLITDHVTVQLKADRLLKRLRHWQGIVQSACEQCGRNVLPAINSPEKFDDWVQRCNKNSLNIVLAPDAAASLKTLQAPVAGVCLLIGPEGGLSQSEIGQSQQQGFKGIRLGPRVLRTETAALTAISIIQNSWGDLA